MGAVCGCSIIFCYEAPSYRPFTYYVIVLSLFHFTEYFITAISNPSNLSIDSFLLNHSIAYWIAAIGSWVEFFVEIYFFPVIKSFWYITYVGIVVCIMGDVVRKLAMLTASTNFNHIVQTKKRDDHQLVTWGVYRFFRHPSYVGWFWWSIGTQIILLNPICIIVYAISSWRFFNDRIYFEELTLINFFGSQYLSYMTKVATGLPFIKGYPLNSRL